MPTFYSRNVIAETVILILLSNIKLNIKLKAIFNSFPWKTFQAFLFTETSRKQCLTKLNERDVFVKSGFFLYFFNHFRVILFLHSFQNERKRELLLASSQNWRWLSFFLIILRIVQIITFYAVKVVTRV